MKIPSVALRRGAMLLLAVSLLAGCAGLCPRPDAPPPPPPPGHGPHFGPGGPPHDPAFGAALHACMEELGVDKSDAAGPDAPRGPRPDREALDACLRGKGIQPPPPRDPAFDAAFQACKATLGLGDEPGPPPPRSRTALDVCLKDKGIALPPPPDDVAPPPHH